MPPPNGWAAFSEDEERLVAYGESYDEVVNLNLSSSKCQALGWIWYFRGLRFNS